MQIKTIQIFIISLLSICSQITYSQELEDYLQIAVENHPQLKAINYEVKSELEKIPQVTALPEPEVGGGIFLLPVETRVGAQRLRLSASQMLPPKGSRTAKAEAVTAMAKAKEQTLEVVKNQLFYELKQIWYERYESKETIEVHQENLELLEAFEQLALIKFEAGLGSMTNVLRVQMEKNKVNTQIENLQDKLQFLQVKFNQILNRDTQAPIAIPDTMPLKEIAEDQNIVAEKIKTQNPALQQFQLQQDAIQQRIKVEEWAFKPSFGVGLEYAMTDKRKDMEVKGNGKDMLMPKVMVKLPLFKSKYEAAVKEQEYKILALKEKEHDISLQLLTALERGFTEYRTAQRQIALYKDQIDLAERALDLLVTVYSTDNKDFEELLRMQGQILNDQLAILKAQKEGNIAVAFIESLYTE
ncbi:MAG: TolC family protein [Chitinophagales bacterium]